MCKLEYHNDYIFVTFDEVMEARYKVGDLMTKTVVVAIPSESIFHCAQKMAFKCVGALIVMDDTTVAGIITEQDIARRVVAKGLMPRSTPVSAVMNSVVHSISSDKDVQEAIELMAKHSIKHLPVIDHGTLEGIITAKDIVAIEPLLLDLLKFNNNASMRTKTYATQDDVDEDDELRSEEELRPTHSLDPMFQEDVAEADSE